MSKDLLPPFGSPKDQINIRIQMWYLIYIYIYMYIYVYMYCKRYGIWYIAGANPSESQWLIVLGHFQAVLGFFGV